MKLNIAAETLAILRDVFIPRLLLADKHQHELDEAIDLGIAALKTIEDGNFQFKTKSSKVYGSMTTQQPQIDLKTLYEQTTMYCDFIEKSYHSSVSINPNNHEKITRNYAVEIWQQPNTPIYIYVCWNTEETHIEEIAYKIIKGEKP